MPSEQFCPCCGRANPMTFRACGNCGQTLSGVLLQQSAAEEETVIGRSWQRSYTPPTAETVNPPRAAAFSQTTADPAAKARAFARRAARGSASSVSSGDPTTCALLSFLFPGLGQIVARQVVKGAILVGAAYFAVSILHLFSPFGVPMMAARILLAVDAYRIAARRRALHPVDDWEWGITGQRH